MFGAVVLFWVAVAHLASGFMCPTLQEAVANFADYNSTSLNARWFRDRGFQTTTRYGCRKPWEVGVGNSKFNFALGCECPSWAMCNGEPFQYVWDDGTVYRSAVGECGCCSGWLIFLIVFGCLLGLLILARGKWCVRQCVSWHRRRQKEIREAYDAKNGFSDLERGSPAENQSAEVVSAGAKVVTSSGRGGSVVSRGNAYRARPVVDRASAGGSANLDFDPESQDEEMTAFVPQTQLKSNGAVSASGNGSIGSSGGTSIRHRTPVNHSLDPSRTSPQEASSHSSPQVTRSPQTRSSTPPLPPGGVKALMSMRASLSAQRTRDNGPVPLPRVAPAGSTTLVPIPESDGDAHDRSESAFS